MKLINPAIADFYNKSNEDTRLQTGLGPLEFERNKILINRYAGPRPLHIADIGGGTGHYASWLTALGHKVTLVDPLPKHIEKAKRKPGSFRCILGEARNLPFENASFDLVILHGPLYHLQLQNERLQAIKEARRIVKPGGTVLGFAITHSASALAALHNGMIHDPSIFGMCSSELLTGEHEAPQGLNGILHSACYHRPNELMDEFKLGGFYINGLHAVEGMAWLDSNFFQSWHDSNKKANLMELISITEQDQSLLCLSPHIMVAASPAF